MAAGPDRKSQASEFHSRARPDGAGSRRGDTVLSGRRDAGHRCIKRSGLDQNLAGRDGRHDCSRFVRFTGGTLYRHGSFTAPGFFGASVAVSLTVQPSAGAGPLLAPASTVTTGAGPRSIAVGDLNGDGRIDLAVATFDVNNLTTLLFGDGKAGFKRVAAPLPASQHAQSIVRADFNNDGAPDLAIANGTSNNIYVFFSNGFSAGTGRFATVPDKILPAGSNPYALATGDFNGDGVLDIACANSDSNDVTILLGDGKGGFTQAPGSPYPVGTSPQAIAVGDLNGDGQADIIVGNYGSNNLTVLTGLGAGTFAAASFNAGGGPRGVAVADLDGDGKLDVAVADYNDSTVRILLGDGSGAFRTTSLTLPTGQGPQAVAIADLDGDGFLDLLIADSGSNDLTVLLGNGAGAFRPANGSPYSTGQYPTAIGIADLNGDGILDVMVANRDSASITVLIGASKPQ